jgi:hypothetical protein
MVRVGDGVGEISSQAHNLLQMKERRTEMEHKNSDRPWPTTSNPAGVHPAWIALIRHCQEMGHGEIERLKIQDGVPVMAERSIQRIKLA